MVYFSQCVQRMAVYPTAQEKDLLADLRIDVNYCSKEKVTTLMQSLIIKLTNPPPHRGEQMKVIQIKIHFIILKQLCYLFCAVVFCEDTV